MNIEIANRLVFLRKAKGFSQEGLAEQLGISRQAVSKWERAESSPDTSNLIMLAKLYGVSLDELLNTDQEKFESSEKVVATSEAITRKANEKSEYVSIGWNGIHIKDSNEEVHIGWQGIHIIEGGKEIDQAGRDYYDTSNNSADCDSGKLESLWSIAIVASYLWIGFAHSLWHPGWLLFLVIPVITSFIQAVKKRQAELFAYPALVTLCYLFLGFVAGNWHPTWVLFLTIPVYYSAINVIRKVKK